MNSKWNQRQHKIMNSNELQKIMFIAMANISIALTVHKGYVYFHTYYLFGMYVKLT